MRNDCRVESMIVKNFIFFSSSDILQILGVKNLTNCSLSFPEDAYNYHNFCNKADIIYMLCLFEIVVIWYAISFILHFNNVEFN